MECGEESGFGWFGLPGEVVWVFFLFGWVFRLRVAKTWRWGGDGVEEVWRMDTGFD